MGAKLAYKKRVPNAFLKKRDTQEADGENESDEVAQDGWCRCLAEHGERPLDQHAGSVRLNKRHHQVAGATTRDRRHSGHSAGESSSSFCAR